MLPGMSARALAVALVLTAALCDRAGHGELAFYDLFASIPAAAAAALASLGVLVDTPRGAPARSMRLLQPPLWALLLALVVASTASRGPHGEGASSELAGATLVASIGVLSLKALLALAAELTAARDPSASRPPRSSGGTA